MEDEIRAVPDCCRHKTKERSEKEYKDLLNRLSRIEGQVRGVRSMLENNAYCTDILVQVSAVNAALNSFNKVLLANHLHTSSGEAVPSTPMAFVSRLTEQDVTPLTCDTAFSTRAAQAAQLIPVTVYCSMLCTLTFLSPFAFL